MKKIFILILIAALITSCLASEEKRFFQMSNFEIDSLLVVTSQTQMTITEKMKFYSELFLETDYSWTCTGDGPYALFEANPLVNFKETNCMVFCEHVLALAISDSWDNFFNNLQQIRYKNGIIGMRTRNHYTMADWLPENNWILNDVSSKVGSSLTKSVTRTISHKNFFNGKKIKDLRYVLEDRKLTVDYVPKEDLSKIKRNLKNGDIGAILFADKKDIFSAHMFMIIEEKNQLIVRESSTSKMSTFDSSFDDWAKKTENSKRYIGASFMRVRGELNKSGQIILPWEINNLKRSLPQ